MPLSFRSSLRVSKKALLLVYHSLPSQANKERLRKFIRRSAQLFGSENDSPAPQHAVLEWQELSRGARKLLKPSVQSRLRLRQLLLTPRELQSSFRKRLKGLEFGRLESLRLKEPRWKAKEKSSMASWPNFPFGAAYLPSHQLKSELQRFRSRAARVYVKREKVCGRSSKSLEHLIRALKSFKTYINHLSTSYF